MSNVETLTGQTIGGSSNPQVAGDQAPASLEKTNTRTKGPLSRFGAIFGGLVGGSLIKKVITAVIIFMILKMTIFR